jgi:hypothetical protein
MDPLDAPAPVTELLEQLGAAGFRTAADERGGMGGARIVLRGAVPDPVEVTVSGDRGQWAIQVRVAGMSRGIVPAAWEAYLDGHEVTDRDLDLDHQAAFVRTRLPEAVAAARTDPTLEATLLRLGTDYMRRLLEPPS